ncbi:MAG TPA: GcrA family cell cycle regulator, partial [Alphaproteobacteria bacterium]|nr:GcrA family cell cycle regulator [Alphaproteobacteria bacterium]
MSWTDERIALLKKMWKDGKSAAEIAKTLGKGVTRNAVIGKAHRMGLSGRPSPIKKPAAPKKEPAAKKERATAAPAAPAAPAGRGKKAAPT